MIVSHRHRFIFLAVPRTGSQSVRLALRPFLDPGDWEQAAWNTRKRLPIPPLAALGHGHLGVRDAEMYLTPAAWRNYFKFALVRDPWDRFLSAAWFTRGGQRLFRARPTVCMALLLRSPNVVNGLHFRPQHTFLERDDGSIGVDFVGRFEHLAEDFATVCEMIGLGRQKLPCLNASDRKHDPLHDEHNLRAAIRNLYARDYELFYKPPGHSRRETREPGDQQQEGRPCP